MQSLKDISEHCAQLLKTYRSINKGLLLLLHFFILAFNLWSYCDILY